jgi:hypothetical protein
MNTTATKPTKRYFLFSRNTFSKTGVAKPVRRAATRGEARAHKDGDTRYGIWDTMRGMAVR